MIQVNMNLKREKMNLSRVFSINIYLPLTILFVFSPVSG